MRKIIKSRIAYKKFVETTKVGFATDFVLDSALLPSPYASSFASPSQPRRGSRRAALATPSAACPNPRTS
jgi:hypothetical protein